MSERRLRLEPGPHWQERAREHPGEETWERLACGEVSAEERSALLDHVVGCSDCTRVYRALAAVERGARRFDPGVPRPVRRARASAALSASRRWWLGAAAAATAAAAVAIWVAVAPRQPVRPPAGEGGALRSGDAVAAVPLLRAPRGIARPPVVFRWQPVAGAAAYRLELLDSAGEIVGSTTTADTSAGWPAGSASAAGHYYWRVVAELERGGSRASRLEDFELAPADTSP